MEVRDVYRRARSLWLKGLLGLIGIQLVWHALNQMPPAWDMAYHQRMGWLYLEAWNRSEFLSGFSTISDYYPPLFYLLTALVFGVMGATPWVAFWVNLPGLILLSYFTFRLAFDATQHRVAALAGLLVPTLPLIAWTSRETLLDATLSGWVALALWMVSRSDGFRHRSWTIGFGVVSALALLTKWTYVLFLTPAVAWAWLYSRDRNRSSVNLLDAVIVSLPAVFWWYLPNLTRLADRFQLTTAGAEWEQDPAVWSLLGWVYYPRCLFSYYLFLPLGLAAVLAVWRILQSAALRSNRVIVLMMTSLPGTLLLLGLLKAKDPRYVMPLAVPVAVLLVTGWMNSPRICLLLAGWAGIQFLLISFSPVPIRMALAGIPGDRDFASMRQEWVLFQTEYFGVAGPPRRENWRYAELLGAVSESSTVGFVPDAAFFHPGALELRSIQGGKSIEVVRLGHSDDWPTGLERADWVIGKTGFQGVSYITRFNREVYEALEILNWPLERTWELPDGSRAKLWRNPTQSR